MATYYASVFFFLVFSVATLDMHVLAHNIKAPPTLFIFGDSTVDVGTNNFLTNSGAKANVPYYGIDFYNSIPTGRFSNGFNTADQIGKHIEFEQRILISYKICYEINCKFFMVFIH